MRIIYPELTKDLKFPKRTFKLKILPSEQELQTFYNGLDEREKVIFTLLRESGLRISELLGAQLDPVNQMLIPKEHSGQTKHSYISFYRTPVNEIPKISKKRVEYLFFENSRKTGIKVNPHLLRSVFARDMSKRGIPSHYIDAYCGRVPQSVLSRSYTDFSPEVLKEIYDKTYLNPSVNSDYIPLKSFQDGLFPFSSKDRLVINMSSKNHKSEKKACKEHKFEIRVFGKVKKNVCVICGFKQDIQKEKKGKSPKIETPKKKSILSVILQYLSDKKDSFTSDDTLKWIQKNHPDMTYNDKSVGLHLRALCIGAKSNPSINKFASLNYNKEAKTFQKV